MFGKYTLLLRMLSHGKRGDPAMRGRIAALARPDDALYCGSLH